jgi:hypothetical protein
VRLVLGCNANTGIDNVDRDIATAQAGSDQYAAESV